MQALQRMGFAIALMAATHAGAASIGPNPVELFQGSNLVARITLVSVESGVPSGGVLLQGAPLAGDETLVLEVEYVAGNVTPGVFVSMQRGSLVPWSATGWIPGADADWTGGLGLGADTAALLSTTLGAGATADRIFVSTSPLVPDEVLRFQFNGDHGSPFAIAFATVVPEPATLTLVGAALAVLAGRRRPRAPRRRLGQRPSAQSD